MKDRFNIDLVILYVNGKDPVWLNEFNKHNEEFNPHQSDGNIITRYDDVDLLKYVFRSTALYAPWINKIHLVVSGESQVPEWLNTDYVHVVYHEDFIPKEYLPTFNSNTIEMFLWNIPELGEHFIYANDDLFFNSYCQPFHFFSRDRIPKNTAVTAYLANSSAINSAWLSFFINSSKLASQGTDAKYISNGKLVIPMHDFKSCSKSNYKDIFMRHKNIILNTISKFRKEFNISIYYFIMYNIFRKRNGVSKREFKYFPITPNSIKHIEKSLNNSSLNTICLNTVPNSAQEDGEKVVNLLENKFPMKCIYER